MPIIQLKPGTLYQLPFKLRGWSGLVHLRLESERPVDVFVVDGHNLTEYREGREYDSYGPDRPRQSLDVKIRLPDSGPWNLVIEAMPRKKRESSHYRDIGLLVEESIAVFYEFR